MNLSIKSYFVSFLLNPFFQISTKFSFNRTAETGRFRSEILSEILYETAHCCRLAQPYFINLREIRGNLHEDLTLQNQAKVIIPFPLIYNKIKVRSK